MMFNQERISMSADPFSQNLQLLSVSQMLWSMYLLRKNFEYSCDQVTFRTALLKKLP